MNDISEYSRASDIVSPYKFESPYLASISCTPDRVSGLFVKDLAIELMDCTTQYDFELDSSTRNPMWGAGRRRADVEELVTWSEVIYGSVFDKDGVDGLLGLVDTALLNNPYRRIDDLMNLCERWFEIPENRSYYVDHDGSLGLRRDLRVTIGNVVAALGLAILDRMLARLDELDTFQALGYHEAAWNCARVARLPSKRFEARLSLGYRS